jgi:hypothetical protein
MENGRSKPRRGNFVEKIETILNCTISAWHLRFTASSDAGTITSCPRLRAARHPERIAATRGAHLHACLAATQGIRRSGFANIDTIKPLC